MVGLKPAALGSPVRLLLHDRRGRVTVASLYASPSETELFNDPSLSASAALVAFFQRQLPEIDIEGHLRADDMPLNSPLPPALQASFDDDEDPEFFEDEEDDYEDEEDEDYEEDDYDEEEDEDEDLDDDEDEDEDDDEEEDDDAEDFDDDYYGDDDD